MAEKKFDPKDINKDGVVSANEEIAAGDVTKTDAYAEVSQFFTALGIPEMGAEIIALIKGDPTLLDNENALFQKIQEGPAYAQRFSGLIKIRDYNKKNPTNPIAVMSEAEYLRAENTYKQLLTPILKDVGPEINKVIGDLIGSNISPMEVQSRIEIATNWAQAADPGIKKALKDFYGMDEDDLVAYALSPEDTTAKVQKRAGMATLASQAAQTQVGVSLLYGENLLQSLVDLGQAKTTAEAGLLAAAKLQDITTGTATAYNPNAGTLVGLTSLSRMEGEDLTGQEVLGAALGTDIQAAAEVRGLKSRERARFEGGSGGTNVLGEQMSGTI